jgi:hypothetical protein
MNATQEDDVPWYPNAERHAITTRIGSITQVLSNGVNKVYYIGKVSGTW